MRKYARAIRDFTEPIVTQLANLRYRLFGPTRHDLQREVEVLWDGVYQDRDRLAALEAVVDRFVAPRQAAKTILEMVSHLPDEEAATLLEQTIEHLKAKGEL